MLEDTYSPANLAAAKDFFVVLSGCSGGGKSALLSGLARRGHRVFAEPGRQVIKEQAFIDGDATPSRNVLKFLDFTISRTMNHMIEAADATSYVFFDRSIVDQISGYEQLNMEIPPHLKKAIELFRYHRRVFMVSPWPEIFRNDSERQHSFELAVASYEAVLSTYRRFGYELVFVPKLSVEQRVEFVLETLAVR